MLGRAQVGIGLAGLALTAAVLANCTLLTGIFIALSALFLVATVANRLPWLHAMPLVGAPTVAVALKLDGRSDLNVGIRRLPAVTLPPEIREAGGGSGTPAFEARTAHLEIGVSNSSRSAIPSAIVTFMHPEGLPHAETDPHGRELAYGRWMPPTNEALGDSAWADYWVWPGDLRAASLLFYFKLTFATAGTYPVRVKINAGDLYKEVVLDAKLVVSEVSRDALPPVDAMAYAIQEAEEVRDGLERPDATSDPQRAASASAAIYMAVPKDRQDLLDVIRKAPISHTGPQVGPEYQAALVNAKLRAAYDVRRRLGP
jgi:hypothetical protein